MKFTWFSGLLIDNLNKYAISQKGQSFYIQKNKNYSEGRNHINDDKYKFLFRFKFLI